MTIEDSEAKQELGRLSKDSEQLLVRVFADFALWLFSVSSPTGKRYTAKATIELVGVLGRYLGPFLEDVNPVGQDAESMTELYWQAMEATGAASFNRTLKGDLSRAMREFDRYLSEFREPGESNKPKFPWFPTGLADVDANPASHEDYHRLLTRIEEEWPANEPWETREIAWLLVALGFRCGLRRMEALYLQVQDVLVRGRGDLIVRPTRKRKLKSPNAERRIPIGTLLTEGEFERLRKWKEHRLNNPAVGPADCLFGIVERDLNPVSEKIFNRINQFMRSADTPDSGEEHFHQLRHGFGTWMFLALLFADQERMPVLFPQLKETNEWLSKCAKLKTGLFRHAYSTRKCAFLLARLLGHSSPGTTLENYVHVADYLVSAGFKLAVLGGSRRHQFNPGPTLEQPKLRIDGAAQSNKIGAGSNGFQKNAEQLG